ncbi:uncharacterized protein N7479_008469 [Penicillium vulpinum]|uniref:uncharacterized protein n=1 Tax=Penicillium vulpinum TaxID=29845 RepID=UPI002547DA1C|nr:uncharacterized protein N7479_008469 [Penicillium vulpinum]KAJ5961319.1 hypothetical protein N7479_008469 [Penicillium vulpinum]
MAWLALFSRGCLNIDHSEVPKAPVSWYGVAAVSASAAESFVLLFVLTSTASFSRIFARGRSKAKVFPGLDSVPQGFQKH